uniref:Uncharacterized protein n=1 Tax=Agrobacterium tumefaciens TaxID=358 RepID=A0A2P0QJV7_AGRTU|nr:hypothetical protein AgrTiChry5_151 [Agrobacterium tumefaciens]
MIPDVCLTPSYKAIVAGCTGTVSIRNVCPGRARPEAPQDDIDHPRQRAARDAAYLGTKD